MDNNKIKIILELEKRGELPENLKPVVDELRKRGALDTQKETTPLNKLLQMTPQGKGVMSTPEEGQAGLRNILQAAPIAGALFAPEIAAPAAILKYGPTVARAIMAAAGGMAGKGVEQFGTQAMGLSPQQSFGENVSGMAGEGTLNAMSEGSLPVFKAGLNKLAPIAKGLGAHIREMEFFGTPVGKMLTASKDAAKKEAQAAFKTKEAARQFEHQAAEATKKTQYIADKESKIAKWLENKNTQKQAFKAAEQAKQDAAIEARKLAQEQVKGLSEKSTGAIGGEFRSVVDETENMLMQNIKEAKVPVIDKFKNTKISAEDLRKGITDILNDAQVLDPKGNIDFKKIAQIQAPERKDMLTRLGRFTKVLRTNPTVSQFNMIVEDLQDLANFGNLNRTRSQKAYGKLARVARINLLDDLEKVAVGGDLQKLQKAKAEFAQSADIISELQKFTEGTAETFVERSRNVLRGEKLKNIIKSLPQLKPQLRDMVVSDIVRSVDSPKTLSNVINKYGRDELKLLLGSEFDQLLTAEKNMQQAFVTPKAGTFVPPAKPKFQPYQATPFMPQRYQAPEGNLQKLAKAGQKISPAQFRLFIQSLRGMSRSEEQ